MNLCSLCIFPFLIAPRGLNRLKNKKETHMTGKNNVLSLSHVSCNCKGFLSKKNLFILVVMRKHVFSEFEMHIFNVGYISI